MNIYRSLKEKIEKRVIKRIIYTLNDSSSENLLRIANILEKITRDPNTKDIISTAKKAIKENHPIIGFVRRIIDETEINCRDKFIENFIIRGLILNGKKREKIEKKGSFAPFSILISPSMRCNLNCIGCYAANYSKKDDMSFETFDRIVTEGEEMGVAIYTILGGEPLIIKNDLFKICKKHNRSYFQFYTNGTLINEKVVEELKRLGNLIPMISVEGYERETDERRGSGVYKKVMRAMYMLKENKIPFGYSVVVTNKNAEIISSNEFIDFMISKGAYIGWHFLYMPIGLDPDFKLMATPKQRKMLRDRWLEIRSKKPIFIIDFWNDAPFVGGCIAGKHYIHITPKGDVEPCIFTHFAVDNVKNKPLKEIMKSDYFKELRKRQPFNENLYLPCMWIDNPEVSREIHNKFNCYQTHPGADTILKDKKLKKEIDEYSKEMKKLFAKVWEEEKKEKKS